MAGWTARLAVVALGLLLAACRGDHGEPAAPPPPEVVAVTLQTEPVSLTRQLAGRVRAMRVAEVRPRVDGVVEQLLFEEGGAVASGQPLYQLDDALYRADLASAEAGLERARARLHISELEAERGDRLLRTGAISQGEHDRIQADLRAARAEASEAEAAVERAATQVERTRITAPIHGAIDRSRVTEGALVTANQAEPLTVIQQLETVHVDVTQSGSEWLTLHQRLASGELEAVEGQPVRLLLENDTPYPWPGQLRFAEASIDPGTGTALMRLEVPNPEGLLRPGMYVRAELVIGLRREGLLVPQRGIQRDPKGSASALVLTPENTVEQRSVTVSLALGDQWLVEEGLAPGDRVVVAGLQRIRPGMTVRVRPAADRDSAAGG